MVRSLTLAASLLLAGTVPALAQAHPGSHPPHPPVPHGPGHVRPDSADHAALHALLHGSWTGTMRGAPGISGATRLSVSYDSVRSVTFSLSADQPFRIGAAGDFVVDARTLSWTQDVSGRPCRATAVVNAPTALGSGTIEGRMTCDDGDLTFTLRKNAG